MEQMSVGKLLRVFIGESDRLGHEPLFEVIIKEARGAGLAGATVVRGVEGFGANSLVIHTAKILRLSEDLPIVIEIVDTKEKIRAFIESIHALFEKANCGGLVTLENIEIIKYTARQ